MFNYWKWYLIVSRFRFEPGLYMSPLSGLVEFRLKHLVWNHHDRFYIGPLWFFWIYQWFSLLGAGNGFLPRGRWNPFKAYCVIWKSFRICLNMAENKIRLFLSRCPSLSFFLSDTLEIVAALLSNHCSSSHKLKHGSFQRAVLVRVADPR